VLEDVGKLYTNYSNKYEHKAFPSLGICYVKKQQILHRLAIPIIKY